MNSISNEREREREREERERERERIDHLSISNEYRDRELFVCPQLMN